jgi:hypothetical protein
MSAVELMTRFCAGSGPIFVKERCERIGGRFCMWVTMKTVPKFTSPKTRENKSLFGWDETQEVTLGLQAVQVEF